MKRLRFLSHETIIRPRDPDRDTTGFISNGQVLLPEKWVILPKRLKVREADFRPLFAQADRDLGSGSIHKVQAAPGQYRPFGTADPLRRLMTEQGEPVAYVKAKYLVPFQSALGESLTIWASSPTAVVYLQDGTNLAGLVMPFYVPDHPNPTRNEK